MGNNIFRECCSSNRDIEHINSFSDDGYDYIDYHVDTRDHICDTDVNVLKTAPGPPIFI